MDVCTVCRKNCVLVYVPVEINSTRRVQYSTAILLYNTVFQVCTVIYNYSTPTLNLGFIKSRKSCDCTGVDSPSGP